VALVVHARFVPSAAREAFAAECEAMADHEAVILVHTCHRVELYVAQGAFGTGLLPQLPPGGQRLEDADAARHLISVACGLKSAVLGEDQILHQVRETYSLRHASRALNPLLDRLFQVALNAGRRAHGWFDGSPRSLGDVALDEIEKNDFNLNLPRYIDSTESEDLQDIDGHLRGGQPARRPAPSLARRGPQGVSRRIWLLVHGL